MLPPSKSRKTTAYDWTGPSLKKTTGVVDSLGGLKPEAAGCADQIRSRASSRYCWRSPQGGQIRIQGKAGRQAACSHITVTWSEVPTLRHTGSTQVGTRCLLLLHSTHGHPPPNNQPLCWPQADTVLFSRPRERECPAIWKEKSGSDVSGKEPVQTYLHEVPQL